MSAGGGKIVVGAKSSSLLGVNWKFLKETGSRGQVRPQKSSLWNSTDTGSSISVAPHNRSLPNHRADQVENTVAASEYPSHIMSYLNQGAPRDELLDQLMGNLLKENEKNRTVHNPKKIIAESAEEAGKEKMDEEDEEEDNDEVVDVPQDQTNMDDIRDLSRSPSPIIIWRPSARVKLATEVPPELLPGYDPLADTDPSLRLPGTPMSGSTELHDQGSGGLGFRGSMRQDSKSTVRNMGGGRAHRKEGYSRPAPTKVKYGAWYIPPSEWKVNSSGGKADDTGGGGKDNTTSRISTEMQILDDRAAKIDARVNKLPISKEYKAYLDSVGARLPHFLEKVELKEQK